MKPPTTTRPDPFIPDSGWLPLPRWCERILDRIEAWVFGDVR